MRKKIFNSLSIIAISAILLTTLTASFFFSQRILDETKTEVTMDAKEIAQELNNNHTPLEEINIVADCRVTIISPSGTVIYDSVSDSSTLENHANRPEIENAIKNGYGDATRQSYTLQERMYYYAVQLNDGNILRLSKATSTLIGVLQPSILPMIIVMFIACIASLLVAGWQTERIVKPINELNLQVPLSNTTYPELHPLLQNLELHNTLRKEFSANVSHELKTPLTSISGYAEIMANGIAKPEDVKKFSSTIYTESQSLIRKINDIIKISKLDEGKINLDYQTISYNKVIESCLLRLDQIAKSKNISFILDLKDVNGEAIPYIIEDAIYNLIQNAIKYNNDNGHIWIRTQDDSKNVFIFIKDDGIGIDTSDLPRIYERFFRADKSHTKTIDGTGLGLAIVKHSISLHKGQIECNSTLNKGTEFILTIPKTQKVH